MKTVLLILALLARQEILCAQCTWYNVSVYPKSGDISSRPTIIIEGLSGGIDVIDAIKSGQKLFLQSRSEKIKLHLTDACAGQMLVSQVLLVPEKNLTLNEYYELTADSLPNSEKFKYWDSKLNRYTKVRYLVTSQLEQPQISIAKLPTKITNEINNSSSCGSSEWVIFNYQIKQSEKEHIFKATVKEINNGTVTKYYILSDSTTIPIGHGVCGGPFDWIVGHTYQLSLQYLDSDGKLYTLTNPITFKSPT